MRPRSGQPSAAARPRPHISALVQVYTRLLQAHEDAVARGQPLLTEVGVGYVRQQIVPAGGRQAAPAPRARATRAFQANGSLPYWDTQSRRLWLGGILVKEFRQPAPNQTMLLAVFQEQGWATAHIDDPLPCQREETEEDAKHRLQETVKNLNRGLSPGTIRFRGDGTGQGVLWQYDCRRTRNTS